MDLKRTICMVLVTITTFFGTLQADVVSTITVQEDTFITDANFFGGPNSNHHLGSTLWCNPFYSAASNNLDSWPLFRFDLSGFSGRTVTSDANLELYLFGPVNGNYYTNAARRVRVGVVRENWTASTATINNFGFNVNWGQTQNVVWNSNNPRYVSWTIPQATIQDWIDNPANNDGLILQSTTNRGRFFYEVAFASMENSLNRPGRLTFSSVPEPTGGLGVLLFSLLALVRRRI